MDTMRLDEKIFDKPANNMVGFITAWATVGGKEVRVGSAHWYTDKEPEVSFELKVPDFTKKRSYKQIVEQTSFSVDEIKSAADVFNLMMVRVVEVENAKSNVSAPDVYESSGSRMN